MKDISDIVKSGLCLGCGFCTVKGNYEMKYSESRGMYLPQQIQSSDNSEFQICPAKGYPIIKMSEELYTTDGCYSIDLGYVCRQLAVSSLSEKVLKNASSGGIMTHILLYLLEQKIVEKVVVTMFVFTENGPRTKTFFTDSIEDILNSQGSKYCPVNMDSFIQELNEHKHEKFAFVGTPCQIAALRKMQQSNLVSKNLVLTIGNFCGGFKNYNNIRKIAQRHGVDYKKINYFRFRGNGQPGNLLMIDSNEHIYQTNYPSYAGYTGYSKILRCHLCVDVTAELADIACGDAWIDEYLKDEKPWSVAICRNKFAAEIVHNMEKEHIIVTREITDKEICYSQRQNIKSKKYRYISRNKLYRTLGYELPAFDGGFQPIGFPMIVEIKIFFVHRLKECIERLGLYKYFRMLINKQY